MYEEQTFDAIMQRMLERIPDTLDKRESSPVYMALAPAAVNWHHCMLDLIACWRRHSAIQHRGST